MNVFQKRNLWYPSLIRFIISRDYTTIHDNSFTISYLINTCGLSQQKAISASKKLHFESSTNPDSVLTLFRANGFSDSHISKIAARYPRLLLSSVEKSLKPKFEFFRSKGLFGADLVKFFFMSAHTLGCSLENKIVPSYESLRSIVGTDENVISILKKSPAVLFLDYERRFAPKLALLHSHGVSKSHIAKLLVSRPRLFFIKLSRFNEIVEEVKKMEFDPSQYLFLVAVSALASMSRSSLEAKLNVYRSWGWAENELRSAFRKFPHCLSLSEENIMSTMDYFVNQMGYDPSLFAKQPSDLTYSLERRIIPRCSVIQVLITNGLVKKASTLHQVLQFSEDEFLKRYVTRFEKEVPELMNTYQVKPKETGLDHCSSIL